ncbi:hypothetical protein ACF1BE_19370 [Streptomyces sp. NPDC014991]|uniref:hypothetical protein n=1 Tax=Streptomyces sp. NPDC014991 TaxID=3364935 RepID=UPI0036F57683
MPGCLALRTYCSRASGPASTEEAFALLRNTFARFDVKLHAPADAVVRTPAPDRDTALRFPGRARRNALPLTGTALDRGARSSQGELYTATAACVRSSGGGP